MTTAYVCPRCKKQIDLIKGKKVAPHYLQGKVRCSGSGKRVEKGGASEVRRCNT